MTRKLLLALGATLCVVLALGSTSAVAAAPNVPYDLPVSLPSQAAAPSVDAAAPYTPAVVSLIDQLEAPPLTLAKIQNVDTLLHDGSNPSCHNVGPVSGPVGLDSNGNPTASTLSAAAPAGATSITVASASTFMAGQTIWVDVTSDAEQATISSVVGTTLNLAAPLTKAHATGRALYVTLTTPSIAKICWTDAQGVLNTSGPNARGSTGPMTLMGLGATFDRSLGNAWGQTEGSESRNFMVTGMFGPQTDLDRIPNWGRNLTTTGEDPYLSHEMVAAQINGMQGVGAMSEMKHFVVYNGQNQNANTDIQDQGLHELYLTPYEGGFVSGRAAATMCSYQIWRDTSANPLLTGSISALASGPSPYANSGENPQTWKLNESHFSCEHPLSLNNVLRDTWGSAALVGSDYPATHSTSGILQGEDQEMPTQNGFFAGGTGTADPTGSTCAYYTGNPGGHTAGDWDPNCTSDSSHIGGIPNHFQGSSGTGCPAPATATGAGGCTLNQAIQNGVLPLSVFNQSVARILYQEQRFGMLGCDPVPGPACKNPGGVGTDRSGTAPLPVGSDSGTPVLGTKNGDAAIVEKYSEEGATLLKNDGHALPLTAADLAGGVLVTGSSANHTVADPTNEASTGFIDRDAVNPLQQLKALSGDPGAFTFVPANDPTGEPVPTSALSSDGSTTGGLNLSVDGGPTSMDSNPIDHTTVSTQGQLGTHSYTWTGYVYVPTTDSYTFAFQQSASVPNANVTFALGATGGNPSSPATSRTLSNAPNIYGATVPGTPTNAGYTEALLTNRVFNAGTLSGPNYFPVTITFNNTSGSPASFRFAYSRTNGDIADAAAAALGKSKAIVFVNTGSGATTTAPSPAGTPYDGHTTSAVEAMSAANVNLIEAVAAANPNTIVVINSDNPVDTSWSGGARSILEMWFAGQEGGTSTARILLGQANPSGHTALTWPANRTDTIWGYNEPANGLYPGSTAGQHLERLNGNAGCSGTGNPGSLACPAAGGTNESEGIFTGYRYFDKLGITPAFPFGYGLSYTTFGFSKLKVDNAKDGGLDVSFTITNTGSVAGADAAQVYVGPPSDQPAGIQFAVRSLAQFDRVELAPGASQKETLHVDRRALSYWSDTKQQWVLDGNGRSVYVGDADSIDRLPLQTTLNTPARGDLTCSDEQINATTVAGNLTVDKGAWCDLIDVTVNGNLHADKASGIRLKHVSVSGNTEIGNASGAADELSSGTNVICSSTFGKDLVIHDSDTGAPWSIGACGPNTVGHDLRFDKNGGSSDISGNAVGHDLTCDKNFHLTGSGNMAGGKKQKQCAGL